MHSKEFWQYPVKLVKRSLRGGFGVLIAVGIFAAVVVLLVSNARDDWKATLDVLFLAVVGLTTLTFVGGMIAAANALAKESEYDKRLALLASSQPVRPPQPQQRFENLPPSADQAIAPMADPVEIQRWLDSGQELMQKLADWPLPKSKGLIDRAMPAELQTEIDTWFYEVESFVKETAPAFLERFKSTQGLPPSTSIDMKWRQFADAQDRIGGKVYRLQELLDNVNQEH